MVAQNTVRTYGVNHFKFFDMLKAFGLIERFVKSDFFSRKRPILLHTCVTCSELPSYISTMSTMHFALILQLHCVQYQI